MDFLVWLLVGGGHIWFMPLFWIVFALAFLKFALGDKGDASGVDYFFAVAIGLVASIIWPVIFVFGGMFLLIQFLSRKILGI